MPPASSLHAVTDPTFCWFNPTWEEESNADWHSNRLLPLKGRNKWKTFSHEILQEKFQYEIDKIVYFVY